MGFRIIVFTTIVVGYLLSLTMSISADNEKPIASEADNEKPIAPENETGLAKDLRLLRKTYTLPQKPPVRASSGDAIGAATRVFSRLNFVGMSKKHVLWVLGDPATISHYAPRVGSKADDPLVYRFDGGFGGDDYRLEFKNGRVTKVVKQGTY